MSSQGLNGAYPDLSHAQCRAADPALLSDAELAQALQWLAAESGALTARRVVLQREQRRRAGQGDLWERTQ